MTFLKPLGALIIVIFFLWMIFYKGNKNQAYIAFILITFPFLHITLTNPNTSVFDFSSIVFYFLFYKRNPTYINEIIGYGYGFAILILIIALGLYFSPIEPDINNINKFIRIFPIFIFGKILIEECLSDPDFTKQTIRMLIGLLIFSLAFLFIQMIIGLEFRLVNTLNPNVMIRKGIRYPSFFSDPQQFSQFLGALSFICLISWRKEKIPSLNYLLFGLAVMGILAAGGRAGLMGWALGLFLLLIFSSPKRKMAIIFSGIVLALFAFYFQENLSIFNRGTDLNDTYDFRAQIWEDAITIFLNHPFLGIGIGNYGEYVFLHYPDQLLLINNQIVAFDQPESGYLLFLSELGGLGFLFIMGFVFFPAARSFFFYFRNKEIVHIQLNAALCCWLIGFYSTYSLGDVRIRILVSTIISLMIIFRLQEKQEMNANDIPDENENYLNG